MAATAKKMPRGVANRPARAKPIAITMVEIDKVDPSPENRRADVDLAPLVESVRTYGIQMPIKVRPKGDRFEIVFGERRWRAAKEVKLTTIPATVEELSDEEAQARRVLENAQRQDPHALEEAESYERLLAMRDKKGKAIHTVESVAAVAGRSAAHVYHRLKLTALAPELRKAFYAGDISVTGAFLIARGIPTAFQAEAWQKMQAYAEQEAYDEELDDSGHLNGEVIAEFIEREYAFRMDTAPFPADDAVLVAGAGACTKCSKRSANQPKLFPEPDRKDVCTDVGCWRSKVSGFIECERRDVLAAGGRVLADEESRRIFNGGSTLPWNSTWVRIDDSCLEDPQRRPWNEVLGDLCPPPALAVTAQGRPVRLVKKSEALDALHKNGLTLGAGRVASIDLEDTADTGESRSGTTPSDTAATLEPGDARVAADVARVTRQRILAAVVAAVERATPADDRFVTLVYETILHGGYHNAIIDTVKRRLGKVPKGSEPAAALGNISAQLTGPSLRALVLELCLSRGGYFVNGDEALPRDLGRAVEVYGIDAAAIQTAVKDDLEAKRTNGRAKSNPTAA